MVAGGLLDADPSVGRDRAWVVATRVTLAVVGVLVVVLVITGIMLAVTYQPDAARPFSTALGTAPHTWVRTTHRVGSQLLLPVFAAAAVASAGLTFSRRRPGRIVVPIAAGVAVVAASVTGYLLPWDQLALYRVTVGTNIRGFHEILFTNHVKYVLVGNTEIASSTYARWFWLHSVGVPVLLIVLFVVLALHTRRAR